MREPQIGRVRGLYIDFENDERLPKRGDRVSSGTTLYYVLNARRVKRRDPNAKPRVQMRVIRREDMPDGLAERLVRSAIKRHDYSCLFEFRWYPRKKKAITFEEYLGG